MTDEQFDKIVGLLQKIVENTERIHDVTDAMGDSITNGMNDINEFIDLTTMSEIKDSLDEIKEAVEDIGQ